MCGNVCEFNFFLLRVRRRGYPFSSGRHGDKMRALEMSKSIVDANVKVGATTRGCSGGRGSDDTRGYGVGSGDVGKELPRGIPVNLCPYGRTCP